jgi:hypothetical protein
MKVKGGQLTKEGCVWDPEMSDNAFADIMSKAAAGTPTIEGAFGIQLPQRHDQTREPSYKERQLTQEFLKKIETGPVAQTNGSAGSGQHFFKGNPLSAKSPSDPNLEVGTGVLGYYPYETSQ